MAVTENFHVCHKYQSLYFVKETRFLCSPCRSFVNESKTNRKYTIPLSGHIYAYIHHLPSSHVTPEKPTLLFLHGFPSTSYEWRHQISHFISCGYGILAPDLLGYGGSSKPMDLDSYIGHSMAAEIISLITHSSANSPGKEIIGIAHDWGTYLLSQLAIYYPSYFTKFVFLSAPFSTPGITTDILRVNEVTKRMLGYEMMGYWLFLAEERAGKILADNKEVFLNLCYPADAGMWKTNFAPTGAMERFLTTTSVEASQQYIAPWVSKKDKRLHYEAFSDGYSASLNWYRRGLDSLGVDEERHLLKNGLISRGIRKNTLMIMGLKDATGTVNNARRVMEACVEKGMLKIAIVDAGHWIMLEKKDETNKILEKFFTEVDGSSGSMTSLL